MAQHVFPGWRRVVRWDDSTPVEDLGAVVTVVEIDDTTGEMTSCVFHCYGETSGFVTVDQGDIGTYPVTGDGYHLAP